MPIPPDLQATLSQNRLTLLHEASFQNWATAPEGVGALDITYEVRTRADA